MSLDHLLENNRRWAAARVAADPDFFTELAAQQTPKHLWIGCSDSRVPANQIIGMDPGQVFVHRNVANQVQGSDLNCMSALQFGVEALGVEHVICCGHLNCGGVNAAVAGEAPGITDYWIWDIKRVIRRNADWLDRLDLPVRQEAAAKLNVIAQMRNLAATRSVRTAWDEGRPLTLHGWVYGLADGILHYVLPPVPGPSSSDIINRAVVDLREQYSG